MWLEPSLPESYEERDRSPELGSGSHQRVILLARHASGAWATFELKDGKLHDAHTFCAGCPNSEGQARDDFARRAA